MALTLDAAHPKDPNPENWRTINYSKVHLRNGRINGGAGGKFSGKKWNGETSRKEKSVERKHVDPIVGLLGEEFKGYKGKEAVDKLLEEKRGFIRGAFHNATLGDIALVYGNDFYGLQHIIKQRRKKQSFDNKQIKALLNSLDEVISHGKLKHSTKGRDTYVIKRRGKVAVISPTLEGNKFTFVLTAFKEYKK